MEQGRVKRRPVATSVDDLRRYFPCRKCGTPFLVRSSRDRHETKHAVKS